MTITAQTFQVDHGLELILYVANRVPSATYHSISKILYFADRIHLSRFGRLLSGDGYVAMEHGPVPSQTYDLLKAAAGRKPQNSVDVNSAAQSVLRAKGYHFIPLRQADQSVISAAERECLDESIAENSHLSFGELTDKSHDAAWRSAAENDFIDFHALVRSLPNADEVSAYLIAD